MTGSRGGADPARGLIHGRSWLNGHCEGRELWGVGAQLAEAGLWGTPCKGTSCVRAFLKPSRCFLCSAALPP